MIAVALDHIRQQALVLGVDTREAVLVDDEDAFTVADVQEGWCHGVVRGTVGIAAHLLQLSDAPCL